MRPVGKSGWTTKRWKRPLGVFLGSVALGGVLFGFAARARAQTSQTFFSPSGQTNSIDYSNYSARTFVFGPAFTAVAGDASALFSNPAGLASLNRGQIALHSFLGLGDTLQETAVVGLPMSLGGIGLAGNYLNYGTFEGRDGSGSLLPSYGADRIGFQCGWGAVLTEGFSLGLALHYSQQDLVGGSTSFLTPDIGVLVEPLGGFRVGLDYLSPGLSSSAFPMISVLRAGVSWDVRLDPSARILAALGNSLQSDAFDALQLGVELSYRSAYFLRVGYRIPFNDNGFYGFSDISFGTGLVLGGLSLDYAYSPSAELGDSNRFSLTFLLGKEPAASSPASKTALAERRTGAALNSSSKGEPKVFPDNQRQSSTGSLTGSTSVPEAAGAGSSPGAPPGAAITVFAQPPRLSGANPQTETGDEARNSLTLKFDIPADFAAQGDQMEAQGRNGEALRLYRQAVQQDPQNASAWWAMGNIYCKFGQKAYAIQCFNRVLELRPDNGALRDWLGKYKAQKP